MFFSFDIGLNQKIVPYPITEIPISKSARVRVERCQKVEHLTVSQPLIPPSHYKQYNRWLQVLDHVPLSFHCCLTSLSEFVIKWRTVLFLEHSTKVLEVFKISASVFV